MTACLPCTDISHVHEPCPGRNCGLARCPGTPWCFNFEAMVEWDLFDRDWSEVVFQAGIWSRKRRRGGHTSYYTPQIKVDKLRRDLEASLEMERALGGR